MNRQRPVIDPSPWQNTRLPSAGSPSPAPAREPACQPAQFLTLLRAQRALTARTRSGRFCPRPRAPLAQRLRVDAQLTRPRRDAPPAGFHQRDHVPSVVAVGDPSRGVSTARPGRALGSGKQRSPRVLEAPVVIPELAARVRFPSSTQLRRPRALRAPLAPRERRSVSHRETGFAWPVPLAPPVEGIRLQKVAVDRTGPQWPPGITRTVVVGRCTGLPDRIRRRGPQAGRGRGLGAWSWLG